MTGGWVLPDEVLRDAPAYAPRPYELADLELLLSGAYAPLTGFLGRADLASLSRRGRLADGTAWPVPVTLEAPDDAVADIDPGDPLRRVLVLTDPVGAPVAAHGDEIRDALLRARVADAYGVTHLLSTGEMLSGGGPRVLIPRELAYDSRDGQWRGKDDIPPRYRRLPLSPEQIDDLLDRGNPLPEWHTPPAVARELARDRPPRRHRGLVLFFTGLSGSGKSTIAHGVADALLETGERTVTVLDGDVVRRELSKGLGFSKADRDLNIRRIGWVAAEVGRHGGMAICCPIAPYAAARAQARELARGAGAGFLLVWVATPLEVCEARDRKGWYAKARAGQLKGMTGIDDPYEEPADADLVLDTSEVSAEAAIKTVLAGLADGGWIDARRST